MNWTHFLLWVAGIYFLYYLTIILIDATKASKVSAANPGNNELRFHEHVEPTVLKHEPTATAPKPEAEVIASGGVPMGEICNLARRKLITYTGAVSF